MGNGRVLPARVIINGFVAPACLVRAPCDSLIRARGRARERNEAQSAEVATTRWQMAPQARSSIGIARSASARLARYTNESRPRGRLVSSTGAQSING